MNISSAQSYASTLFGPKEHPAACQCPGCCKSEQNTSALKANNQTKTTQEGVNKAQSSTQADQLLSSGEKQQLAQLQQRDTEVRAHET